MIVRAKVRLTYPSTLLNRPLLHGLMQKFGLETNILQAQVGEQGGWITLTIRGKQKQSQRGLAWLRQQGVEVELLAEEVEEA